MKLYSIQLSAEDRERLEYLRKIGKFDKASNAFRALLRAWSDIAEKNNKENGTA